MHQLAGLREFADIHLHYQRDGHTINASAAWKKNFAAMHKLLKLQTHLISQWMGDIEKTVQGLALAKVSSEAVNVAVCWNVIDCLGSFDYASDPTAALWLQQADTMQTRNDACSYVWSELYDLVQSHLAADSLKEECNNEASTHETLKKRKTVSTDWAQVFFTLAQMQAVYFMGQQQNGGSPKATPCQPKGGGKAPRVNTDPNTTCPKCKIHHQGGLHTCLNYQESKQMIKAKYNNRKVQKKNK
eukprot:2576632-Rhodomonas_salina.1